MCDIVDAVEESCTFFIKHVLTLSSNDFQRIGFVKQLTRFSTVVRIKNENGTKQKY